MENNYTSLDSFITSLSPVTDNLNKLKRIASRLWVKTEHRCPVCDSILTDPQEVEFMESVGMCLKCDHVLTDYEITPCSNIEFGGSNE